MIDATPHRDSVSRPVCCSTAAPLLVFTDLDGTLLDHHSYSFAAALPALRRLRRMRIPLIPVTSKTLAELRPLMRELDNPHPCIAENGGLIAVPPDYFRGSDAAAMEADYRVVRLSPPYADLLKAAHGLRTEHGFRFRGFSDMSTAEVAEHTGLTPAQAQRAKRRLSSEPLLWLDTPAAFERFRTLVASQGLQLVQGGRFWHLMGRQDKASAMRRLCEHYRANGLTRFQTVALGDSPNDIAMLQASDIPVVIRRSDGRCLSLPEGGPVACSELPGPGGWNQMVLHILDAADSPEATVSERNA
ncbi:MAG: HAD-IIB family hydrolase [Gammaproteobacteria bacterium]|jgi:mannosyl-3-phosphoglycerate phosphatase